MSIIVKFKGVTYDAVLDKGKPVQNPPKSYKKIGVFRHSLGNRYNSSIGDMYQRNDLKLVYSIYRDGCISPFMGLITLKERE